MSRIVIIFLCITFASFGYLAAASDKQGICFPRLQVVAS